MTVEDIIKAAAVVTPIKVIVNVGSLMETIEGTAEDFCHDAKNWQPVLNRDVMCVQTEFKDGRAFLIIHASSIVLGVKGKITK